MLKRLAALLLFLAMNAGAEPSYITFPSDIAWSTRKSEHFEVIFRNGKGNFAAKILQAAERAHKLIDPIFPPGPEKTYIVLADFHDSTNGYALDFPYPHMVLFASPPNPSGQLAPLDDWIGSLVLHEYVHIRHIYPAGGLWKPMRTIFGSWVMPNGLMPSHFHEGIAVFLETELTKGGRGRGATFNMYRRKAVEAGAWGGEFSPLDRLDGVTSQYPHGTSAYFFGYLLDKDLWEKKGAKGIYALTDSYSSNWPYFLNGPLSEVYGEGVSYRSTWDSLFAKSKVTTEAELQEIKKEPLSELKYVTTSRFNKSDLSVSPDGKLAAYRRGHPEEGSGIDLVEAATGRFVTTLESDAPVHSEGMCWQSAGGTDWLIYTKPVNEYNYSLNALVAYDIASEKTLQFRLPKSSLKHVLYVGCAAKEPRIIFYREVSGQGFVQEATWNPAAKDPELLQIGREWKLPAGTWVSGILPGNPNYILLRQGIRTTLFSWGKTPETVLEMNARVFGLKSGAANELLAIGDFSGRDEVWEINPTAKHLKKRVAVVGGVNSFGRLGDSYLVASFEHGGYDLARASAIDVTTIPAQAPDPESETIQEDSKITAPKDYSAWGTLLPRTWVPTLLFVPSGAQIGVWIPGFDLAQKHAYNIFGGYDTRGLFFVDLSYFYRVALTSNLRVGAYYAPSYIQSTGDFLKRWGGVVGFSTQIPGFAPTISFNALFRTLEYRLLSPPTLRSVGVGIDLSYSFGFKKKPIAIIPSAGTKLTLGHDIYLKAMGSTHNFFSTTASVDQYVGAPWAKWHGFYLGSRFGYTEGTLLFNSFFEGGGELLFSQFRNNFLARGYYPGSFLARRIFSQNLEYRFPIWRTDRGLFGNTLFPLLLKVVHASLVADIITADFGLQNGRKTTLFKNFYGSIGAELKSDWLSFFYLPAQARVGVYKAMVDAPGGSANTPGLYVSFGLEAAL